MGNLYPAKAEEQDSFMYQTVGVEIVPAIAKCLGVPIVRRAIQGGAVNQDLYYKKADGEADEVEDLYNLLVEVKQ